MLLGLARKEHGRPKTDEPEHGKHDHRDRIGLRAGGDDRHEDRAGDRGPEGRPEIGHAARESRYLTLQVLGTLKSRLRERYNRSGEGWITGTTLDGRRVLRVTIMNPRTTTDDVRAVLEGIAREAVALTR